MPTKPESRKKGESRNYELIPGLMRYSRARMYKMKRMYALKKKTAPKKAAPAQDKYVVKKIQGDKNGGERKVLRQKPPKRLPVGNVGKPKPKRKAKIAQCKLRRSITPGTVLILLAGRHKGKRVVFLKQLEKSGCLLVTGPLKLNNCPLRRIPQSYVIATKTKLDVSHVNVPEHINDDYFKRAAKPRQSRKGDDADLFTSNKQEYVLSDQRKEDQQLIDKQVLEIIRKHKDKKMLFGYIGSYFWLGKGQAPHRMVF